MSNHDTDVLARLRAGADTVKEHQFDAQAVLVGSRRALRRRRSWQAVGACTTAAVVAFSLALAGPVPVPGLGDVTLPGSEEVRELLGIADADVSTCEAPEPVARRSPVESGTNLRPAVTFDLARARALSSCFDIQLEGQFVRAGLYPSTLTEDGTFWSHPEEEGVNKYFHRVDPLGDGSGDPMMAPVSTALDDAEHMIGGLTPQGDVAAWFEIASASVDQPPSRVVLAAGGKRTDRVTGEYYETRAIKEIEGDYDPGLAVTAQRVAWRQEDTSAGSPGSTSDAWGIPAWAADLESGEPWVLAEQATAIGGDNDEIVVATLDQPVNGLWTTTFTSFGDDGTETTVLTLKHPSETYVQQVDITDDVLTYALDGGYHLAVVSRVNGVAESDDAIAVRLGSEGVDSLSASGDAVVWVSGSVAYLLRDAAPGSSGRSDLVRIGQGGLREGIRVGIAGDRIAWSSADLDYRSGEIDTTSVRMNVGTLLGPAVDRSILQSVPEGLPEAPTVTVPEDAIFRTYD
ncbi:hypothetical protein ACFO6V_26720 [Promicromonospora alba]|uniref:Type VII secretion protein EccB n=1 Tax=Promicromonospora alba TaxID=1616110 RepID=A0ABV9HRN5_9MICO